VIATVLAIWIWVARGSSVAQPVYASLASLCGFDRQVLRSMSQDECEAIEWFGFGLALFTCVTCAGLARVVWLLSRELPIAWFAGVFSLAYAWAVVRLLAASAAYRDVFLACAFLLCPSVPSFFAARRALSRYDARLALHVQRGLRRDARSTQRALRGLLAGEPEPDLETRS